jgi:predicted phage tail protein
MSDLILGAGGGGGKNGGKAYVPSTARDGLDSVQYAKVIDLISEGEIQGLKDGHKSIYINNTPLQNADGSYNFQNVTVYTTTGTQSQSPIPISNDVESEFGVGTTVLNGLPVIKSITKPSVDAARITISIPQLQGFTDKGDIIGARVRLQIAVQYAGGGFTTVVDDTIAGRSGDLYQKTYLINFTGSRPVDIRVTRVTDDSTDPKLTNAFSWASYTEITYAKLRYPNSALVGLRIDAEQFSSIPSRSYLVRGIKVKIPNNATVDSTNGRLIYSGIWNGTFGAAAWTTDPCWILWDLLTATRFGFGDHIQAATLDKWAFYSASQYASTLVQNGFGGYEPRFSCNCNIQTQEDAFKLINDLCSVFRAQSYWSTGSVTVSQDKPSDPAYLFTLANVAEGGFSYQNSSKKTRPTVAVISYLDLSTRDIAYEAVEDKAAIAKYGVITTQISAFACTSRGQASRIGKWLLFAENYESEIVSFTASLEAGVVVRPGQVIEIADPMRAGSRRGGRISSASTTVVTVDDATGLTVANTPMLSVILKDGTVQTRSVTNITGKAITVGTAFTSAPLSNSIWVFESTNLQTSTWRVLGVAEQDECQYAVTAIAYNASKYSYIEDGAPLQVRNVSNLNAIPAAPTNLTTSETLYTYQDQVRAKVVVSWKPVVGVNQYEVRWRKDSGNWTVIQQPSIDFQVLDITPGTFDFKIYSLNAAGKPSSTALSGSITALGKTAPPSDVETFTAALDPTVGVTLNWSPIADLDLQGYEIWQGSAWGSGTQLGLFSATSKKLGLVDAGTTTWWINALDTSGVYSSTAASTSLTITAAGAPTASGIYSNDSLILSWTAVTGSLSTDYYELRYGTTSSTWATATVLGTVQGTTYAIKGAWVGTRRFFIAAVDLKGNVGTAGTYNAVVIAPSQPTVTQQVIDNNVLLQWTDSTQTLPIVAYELRKGASWAAATVIGTKQGKFTTVFESVAGTFVYWLAGIDSGGNYGTPGSVSAQVNQPPDYVLKLNQNSTFTGTTTNLATLDVGLLASVSTTETWQSHFTSRSWTTPQDQITAGFPYFAMPSQTSGQYYEEINYGTVLAGTKVTGTLTSNNVAGASVITPSISVRGITTTAATYTQTTTTITVTSTAHGLTAGALVYLSFTTGGAVSGTYTVLATGLTANAFTVTSATSATIASNPATWIKWTVYAGVSSVFATNFQYARIQYDFSSAGGDDLLQITGLNVRLDSKLRNDSGTGTANSADSGGTVVNFTLSPGFVDVDSISVTPLATSSVTATYSFTDVPNPTQFTVYLWNSSGTRINGAFSWSARGV